MGTFRNHHLLILAVMVCIVLAGGRCFGADEAALFERAYGHYIAYRPEKAVEGFNTFMKEFPSSSALDAAFFWKAKALVRAGREDEAREVISSFGEKFPDSPFRKFTSDILDGVQNARAEQRTRTPEPRNDRNSKVNRALADKVKALEARISELDADNRRTKKSIAKMTDEKASLARELRESRKNAQESAEKLTAAGAQRTEMGPLQAEKASLESRVKELESRLAAASEETRRAEEKSRLLALERDDALSALRSGGEMPSSVPAAAGPMMAREKELREFNEYIRKVKELEAERNSLQERWDRYRQEKETELKRLKAERDSSPQAAASPAVIYDTALEDLHKKLADSERKGREADDQARVAAEERIVLAATLKDAQQKLAGLAPLKESYEKERARALRAEEERDRLLLEKKADSGKGDAGRRSMKDDGAGAKAADDLQALKIRELAAENISLRERLARFERPVVRISGNSYSQAQIDEDRAVAARVLGMIRKSTVSWHTGNAYEDFAAEKVLEARAGKDDLRRVAKEAAASAKQYSFNVQEQGYLVRFLAADDLVSRKKEYPREEDLRNYYETHGNEFMTGKGEQMVQYITLRQNSGDKLSGVQLVSDLQREAMSGKSLEDIARRHTGKVSFTRARMTEIPAWIRDKVNKIREGTISNLFTEDQFVMLQVVTKREARGYDEVKGEIRTRLINGEKDVAGWLGDIRKEAEDLR